MDNHHRRYHIAADFFSSQFAYTGPASSAEWIVEDPTVTSGTPPVNSQPPLANFGTTPFSNLGVKRDERQCNRGVPRRHDRRKLQYHRLSKRSRRERIHRHVYMPLSITTGSLPTADINTSYSQTLTASGGALPYVWSITSGTLPTGLMLNASSGAVTGLPTVAGNQNVTFEVTDALGQVATATLSIPVVTPGPYSPLPPARICDTRAGNPSSLTGRRRSVQRQRQRPHHPVGGDQDHQRGQRERPIRSRQVQPRWCSTSPWSTRLGRGM